VISGTNTPDYPQAQSEPGDFLLNNEIELECDDELIFVTVRMYKFFLAHGKDGLDAKQLFDHLLFTSRIQKSRKVMANLTYIKNGLGWGRDKTKKAKAFLCAAGLIEYTQSKNDTGQYGGQKIILKKSWNTETLLQWIEKRKDRQEELPKKYEEKKEEIPEELSEETPENEGESSGGLNSSPPVYMGSSENETPDSRWSGLPLGGRNRPTVTDPNYKGSYKKRNLPQEENPPPTASSPPPASFNSLSELKSHLISLVKKRDPESMFYFTGPEDVILKTCFNKYGPDWIIDRFKAYLKSKNTVSQINRFHADDFPRVLKRAMEKSELQKPKAKPLQPKDHECPVCGKTWTASSTLSTCPRCGMDLKDFNDSDEVKSHKQWYETVLKPRQENKDGNNVE